jgi:cytochrome c
VNRSRGGYERERADSGTRRLDARRVHDPRGAIISAFPLLDIVYFAVEPGDVRPCPVRDMMRVAPIGLCLLIALAGCQGGHAEARGRTVPGGDARRGESVIEAFGCGACHTIPGVDGASGMVGPPLTSWARRAYIAGTLPNAPENLIRWVVDPHAVEPGTAMPQLGVNEAQARDIAAYLYTLQ